MIFILLSIFLTSNLYAENQKVATQSENVPDVFQNFFLGSALFPQPVDEIQLIGSGLLSDRSGSEGEYSLGVAAGITEKLQFGADFVYTDPAGDQSGFSNPVAGILYDIHNSKTEGLLIAAGFNLGLPSIEDNVGEKRFSFMPNGGFYATFGAWALGVFAELNIVENDQKELDYSPSAVMTVVRDWGKIGAIIEIEGQDLDIEQNFTGLIGATLANSRKIQPALALGSNLSSGRSNVFVQLLVSWNFSTK